MSNFERAMHLKTSQYLIIILLLLRGFFGVSQTAVSGRLTDKEGNPMPGVLAKALNTDSSFVTGATSDSTGKFTLSLPSEKKFILLFSLLSYSDHSISIETDREKIRLGKIVMKEDARILSEVVVKTTQTRGEQKGDTTQFNADAFKTNPDATAEDLIKKMPGVSSDNEGVKVNGETVEKILVDGKPFFGDDPNAALKNLPAEIIDKVEVFDKLSEQAQFTGFNDGDQQKTINFVTKKGKNAGQFGRIYGGAGSDENEDIKYSAGAAIHAFSDKRRISLLLLSNNINQQNFSSADITGAMSNSGQSQGRGGYSPGRGYRSSPALLAANQNGITATQAAGLNYSDEWGKKMKISGSYFFNYSDNNSSTELARNYFSDNKLVYEQINNDKTTNLNHRANFRFEYEIDSSNKIIITPALSFQDHRLRSSLSGSNTILDSVFLSNTSTNSNSDNTGYDFSNWMLYQHKFRKEGRTVSLNLFTQVNENNNGGSYNSYNRYTDTVSGLDQLFSTYSNGKKASLNLSYTEPLTRHTQLLVTYNPSITEGMSDKATNDFDSLSSEYVAFNPSLSNKYNNIYETQRAGLGYKYRKNKLYFSFGAAAQQSSLKGDQTFPVEFKIHETFQNILPNAHLNYKFSKTRNLRMHYRTSTNIPSLSQLQNVIDVSNPLQVKSGNAELEQTFENSISLRFGGFNPKTSRNIMLFANAGFTDNYISNATYMLERDSLMQGFVVKAGSQLTKPVNLNGYNNSRLFFVFGFPVTAIKSNLNFNGGINYAHAPALNNNVLNFSDSYATSGGLFIGSNISQNFDFSLGYNGNYTIVKNTVQKQSDNNFFSHAATFKLNLIIFNGLVINTDVSHNLYNGLTQGFNQEYILWNAYIGYKFFKNKSLEAKVSVFDILKQNLSISRTVTGNYTEDNNTVVLQRYALFSLTYTLRNFKNGTPPKEGSSAKPGHGGWQGRPH